MKYLKIIFLCGTAILIASCQPSAPSDALKEEYKCSTDSSCKEGYGCNADSDCTGGLRCISSFGGRKFCTPPTKYLGRSCTSDNACGTLSCIRGICQQKMEIDISYSLARTPDNVGTRGCEEFGTIACSDIKYGCSQLSTRIRDRAGICIAKKRETDWVCSNTNEKANLSNGCLDDLVCNTAIPLDPTLKFATMIPMAWNSAAISAHSSNGMVPNQQDEALENASENASCFTPLPQGGPCAEDSDCIGDLICNALLEPSITVRARQLTAATKGSIQLGACYPPVSVGGKCVENNDCTADGSRSITCASPSTYDLRTNADVFVDDARRCLPQREIAEWEPCNPSHPDHQCASGLACRTQSVQIWEFNEARNAFTFTAPQNIPADTMAPSYMHAKYSGSFCLPTKLPQYAQCNTTDDGVCDSGLFCSTTSTGKPESRVSICR